MHTACPASLPSTLAKGYMNVFRLIHRMSAEGVKMPNHTPVGLNSTGQYLDVTFSPSLPHSQ